MDRRGRRILDAIVADPNVDLVICPITGALASMSGPLARDLVAVAETTDKPICVIWGSPVGTEAAYTETLLQSRLPVFRTFGNCVAAVKAYFDYYAFLERHDSPFARPITRTLPAAKPARAVLSSGAPPTEHEAKRILAAYGIPVTRDEIAGSPREALRAAESIGFPVVVKAAGPIAHKSDLGLVRLGLTSSKEVRDAYSEIVERGRPHGLEGVLVSEMVEGGVETVVGIAPDPLFGPTVMFGLGGVFVEVLGDVTFRVPPFSKGEARRMVEEVKGYPLLTGARGRARADVNALVDVIMRVQRIALDLAGELAELDINPLVVREKGAVALDALAVPRRP
jgi:acyl-CoA synthetase (NDP forming)